MKRIRLTVAYDGTDYCGWQVQNNVATIEGELNTVLTQLTGQTVKVIGASRTDSGVHAMGNVAVFDTESRIPGDKICFVWTTLTEAEKSYAKQETYLAALKDSLAATLQKKN